MAKIVTIDASAAISWLVPAQSTQRAEALLAGAQAMVLTAPDIFAWEVGNLIMSRGRRGQIDIPASLASLELMGIRIAPPRPANAVFALTAMSAATGLSLFDAAYLDEALQTGSALASRDLKLLQTATRHGVECLDLNDPRS